MKMGEATCDMTARGSELVVAIGSRARRPWLGLQDGILLLSAILLLDASTMQGGTTLAEHAGWVPRIAPNLLLRISRHRARGSWPCMESEEEMEREQQLPGRMALRGGCEEAEGGEQKAPPVCGAAQSDHQGERCEARGVGDAVGGRGGDTSGGQQANQGGGNEAAIKVSPTGKSRMSQREISALAPTKGLSGDFFHVRASVRARMCV